MTNASRPTFLRRFGRRRAHGAPDFADMGTAFALDEAIDHAAREPRAPGEPPPLRVAAAGRPWRRWLGRKVGA